LVWRQNARQRLLDQLIRSEPQQRKHRVVRLKDLSFEIRNEDRVGSILDQTLGVRSRFVDLPHIPKYSDSADHLSFGIAKRGCVQSHRNYLARGAARIQTCITGYSALDHLV